MTRAQRIDIAKQATLCLGICTVAAFVWDRYERKHRRGDYARPTVSEHNVERYVRSELARIGFNLGNPRHAH